MLHRQVHHYGTYTLYSCVRVRCCTIKDVCFLYGNGFPLSFPTVCGEIIAGSDTISPAQNTMNRNVRIALVGNKIDLAPTKTADKHYHSSGRSVCHSLHSYTLHDIQCAGIKHSIAIMVFCVK